MTPPKRIEICGIIASGKTSLAKLVAESVPGVEAIYENFSENPFLESFYQSPDKYAFETEITFLLQHYSAIKASSDKEDSIICDYAMLLDTAFANVTLRGGERETFLSVQKEALKKIGEADLLIHLQCPPEVALRRIEERSRGMEQTIPLDYLSSLDTAIASLTSCISNTHFIEIDSHALNYVKERESMDRVIELIGEHISM